MKLKSTRLGEFEYSEEDIISFPDGLPGFADEKEFIILSLDENSPIRFLHSLCDKDLFFVIINPFLFFYDYEFDLPQSVIDKLEIRDEKDVQVWNIVVVKEPFQESTVNLKAPVIINVNNKKGKQALLERSPYSTKAKLFSNEGKMANEKVK